MREGGRRSRKSAAKVGGRRLSLSYGRMRYPTLGIRARPKRRVLDYALMSRAEPAPALPPSLATVVVIDERTLPLASVTVVVTEPLALAKTLTWLPELPDDGDPDDPEPACGDTPFVGALSEFGAMSAAPPPVMPPMLMESCLRLGKANTLAEHGEQAVKARRSPRRSGLAERQREHVVGCRCGLQHGACGTGCLDHGRCRCAMHRPQQRRKVDGRREEVEAGVIADVHGCLSR